MHLQNFAKRVCFSGRVKDPWLIFSLKMTLQETRESGPNPSRLPSATDHRIPSPHRCFIYFSDCHCLPFFAGLHICRVPELLDVNGGIVPGPHARRGGSVLAARVTRVKSSVGGGGGGGIQRQSVGHGHGRGGGGGGDGRFRELGSWHQPSSVIVFPQRTHPCLVRCTHPSLCTS